jgi:hypothetical protein
LPQVSTRNPKFDLACRLDQPRIARILQIKTGSIFNFSEVENGEKTHPKDIRELRVIRGFKNESRISTSVFGFNPGPGADGRSVWIEGGFHAGEDGCPAGIRREPLGEALAEGAFLKHDGVRSLDSGTLDETVPAGKLRRAGCPRTANAGRQV